MPIAILHLASHLNLAETSQKIFSVLKIPSYAEHDSQNYPTGTYFQGSVGGLKVQVSYEDDRGYEDCQYWVTLRAAGNSAAEIEAHAERAARVLIAEGFKVYRGAEESPQSITRIAYFLEPSGALGKRTEKIAIGGSRPSVPRK